MSVKHSPIRDLGIKLKIILAAIFVSAFGAPIHAQEEPPAYPSMLIGINAGLNFVHYSTNKFPILDLEPTCLQAQNGNGVAPRVGIDVLLPLDPKHSMRDFIVVDVGFDEKSASFTSIGEGDKLTFPTKMDGMVGPGSASASESAGLAYLSMGIGWKHNLFNGDLPIGPSIILMPQVALQTNGTLTKAIVVTSVMGAVPSQSTTKLEGSSKLRLSITGQICWDIPISKDENAWVISPFAGYDLGITTVKDDISWHASSVIAGISLHRVFFTSESNVLGK